jgi:hypothetical protein
MGGIKRVAQAWADLGHDVLEPSVTALIERGAYPIAGADGEGDPQVQIGEGVATAAEPAASGNGNGGGDLGAVTQRMDQVLERFNALEQRLPAAPAQPQQPAFDPNDPLAGMQGIGEQQPQPGQQPQQGQLGPDQLAALQAAQQQAGLGLDPQTIAALQAQGIDPNAAGQQQFDQFGNPIQQPMSPYGGGLGDDFFQQQQQQAMQQMLAPLAHQIQQLSTQVEAGRRETEATGLLEDYPELKDPETAKSVVSEAQKWAQDLGNPALAGEPGFVELVHLAAKTVERAQGETPAGEGTAAQTQQQPVSLEQPGGTPGPAAGGEPSEVEKIMGAVQRHPIFG